MAAWLEHAAYQLQAVDQVFFAVHISLFGMVVVFFWRFVPGWIQEMIDDNCCLVLFISEAELNV